MRAVLRLSEAWYPDREEEEQRDREEVRDDALECLRSETHPHEEADEGRGAEASLLDHLRLIALDAAGGRGVRGLQDEAEDEEREDAAHHDEGGLRWIGRGDPLHEA